MTTNGMASFFSCEYSPGAMKSQTCASTTGEARIRPAMSPILNIRKICSPGSMEIIVCPAGSMACIGSKMNVKMSSSHQNAMPNPPTTASSE